MWPKFERFERNVPAAMVGRRTGCLSCATTPAGTDVRTLKDKTGRAFGQEVYAAAQKPEGQITEISDYFFPRPGPDQTPVQKISFVTRVGDLGCDVGYYKD